MIDSLPPAESFEHGTRARSKTGCRCAPCRAANAAAAAARTRAVRDAAAGVAPNPGSPLVKTFYRGGGRIQVRGRACPGTGGRPCVAGGAWLRGREVCLACVDRAVVWNGLVPADRARQHLAQLSAAGIGYRTVADAAGLNPKTVAEIIAGQAQLRAEHERRILAVDTGAAEGGARVDAAPTWRSIRWLLGQGLTRGEIAQRIGNETPALQLRRKRVLASTARRVAELRREVEAEIAAAAVLAKICATCGYSHAPEDRQRIVARMASLPAVEIVEAWPCFYKDDHGYNGAGYRRLMRDLAAIRRRAS